MPPAKTMEQALIGDGDSTGALLGLAHLDADIAKALQELGTPPDRTLPHGFATLARIIIGQQISTKAAGAVWAKMQAKGFDESRRASRARIDTLKGAGLSQMKAQYVKGLAQAVEDGSLDFAHLATLSGVAATQYLTRLKGIGNWTADNYRLFVLLDMDAWPYNDLALQGGMQILKSLDARPDGTAMAEMGEAWKPYRGAGALMLWHIYAQRRRAASVADIT